MSEPIHIISLGAGVQSSTMALMAAHGEIPPMPKCAIFADTQDEPEEVYDWLVTLKPMLPFPVHTVTSGKLSESATRVRKSRKTGMTYVKTGLPFFVAGGEDDGFGRRQCTRDFKITPILRLARAIRNGQHVVMWKGISLDEIYRLKPAKEKWITNRHPLVDMRMRRHDCLIWMKKNGYPEPPRSSCDYCPYHSDREWRRIRDENPDSFARSVAFDKRLREVYSKATAFRGIPYLHESMKPLDQVDFSTDEDHGQQVMFGNECEGMCGV